MSTKYYGIDTTKPTYAEPGQKGARNVDNLVKIFPKPFGNVVGNNDGKQVGNFKSNDDGTKGTANDVDTKDDMSYQQWFIDHVVNGVVESKWLVDTTGGSSTYSMNYIGAPDKMIDDKPLLGKDGLLAGTNQFVPVLVTQADEKTGVLTPGIISPSAPENAVKTVAENFMKKSSEAPGTGPKAGTEGRNPAMTSAKQKAANNKTLTLGYFLSQPKK